jgi:hypothetical protein
MANEIWWITDWFDNGEWVRKDTNQVTEQDIRRVQSNWAKAKKIQNEIKKKKIENNDIANFLSFLLKNIKNDQIISSIYDTFFKVTDKKTNIDYIRKSMNNIVIIWFFAPFFPIELKKFKLNWYFKDFCKLDGKLLSFNEYINYIKNLSKKYHDNIPINQNQLLELLSLIIWEFGISKEALTDVWRQNIKNDLMKKLK